MSGPLVSIVVPVYNVESYIEECLQSVCSQTYENLEIICVDDVGNDRSMDVVRSGVSGFLCLGRLFQGQPNEAALCI